MIRVKIKGPYLDFHDLWRGVYWRAEAGGWRLWWCPVPAVVVRLDLTPRGGER